MITVSPSRARGAAGTGDVSYERIRDSDKGARHWLTLLARLHWPALLLSARPYQHNTTQCRQELKVHGASAVNGSILSNPPVAHLGWAGGDVYHPSLAKRVDALCPPRAARLEL